jgi:energy-converting hydrogenase Eha subunit H
VNKYKKRMRIKEKSKCIKKDDIKISLKKISFVLFILASLCGAVLVSTYDYDNKNIFLVSLFGVLTIACIVLDILIIAKENKAKKGDSK